MINRGRAWRKGESGNLKGRPQKISGVDKLIAKVLGEAKDGMTAAEIILRALRARAVKGDVRATQVLLEH